MDSAPSSPEEDVEWPADVVEPESDEDVAEPVGRPGTFKIHTVEAGEDLHSVAMMWGVSPARIRDINGLGDDDRVAAGQRLKIPLSD